MRGPNGERTFRCGYCMDTSYVTIWRPSARAKYRQAPESFKPLSHEHRFCLPCCCEAGQLIAQDKPHYQPTRHPRQWADFSQSADYEEAVLASLLTWEPPAPTAKQCAGVDDFADML